VLSISSIRLRLTLWYATVLALALAAMALATYSLLDRLASRRATWSMLETTGAVFQTAAARGGIEQAVRSFRAPDRRVLLFGPDGRLRAASQPLPFGPPVAAEVFAGIPDSSVIGAVVSSRRARSRLVRLRPGDPEVRVSGRRLRRQERGLLVVVASTGPERALREQARLALFAAVALTLIVAVVPGAILVRRSLAPIADMTRQADRIGAERLGERLPVGNPRDELGALARVFNAMLDRLQAAFEQQRRLMAEAAHELRTPVSVLRAEAELALSGERTPEEYRAALTLVGEESDRLGRVVDDLLTYSRAEAGQHPVQRRAMDLGELAADATRSLRTLAARKGVTLHAGSGEELTLVGDPDLIRRLVLNLVENAVKHGRPGDSVRVEAGREGADHTLTVSDTGPGVPEGIRDRIFEPFYRGSDARAAETSGAGLGLPIARWIAEVHGGTLTLLRSGPEGSVFQARFPAERA